MFPRKAFDSADPDEQKRLAAEIQGIALADVLYVRSATTSRSLLGDQTCPAF